MLLPAVILGSAVAILVSVFLKVAERKMNPMVAFIWIIAIIVDSIILSTPVMMLALFSSIVLTKIFVRSELWNAYLKMGIYMLVFIVAFNILLVRSGTVIWQFWIIKITDESLTFAYTMGMRLMVLMSAFAVFSSNVNTDDLIQILETMRVPQRAYMSIVIAFRFFDVLTLQAQETMLAVRARGLPVGGGIKNGIRYRYPLLMSLMKNSMDRAMDIAETLELRGFPSATRKAWRKPRMCWAEKSIIAAVLMSTIMLFLNAGMIYNLIAIFLLSTSAIEEGGQDD